MNGRLRNEPESIRIIRPHLGTLEQCLSLGWADWERARDFHSGNGHAISPAARARIVYDFVTQHARRLFMGASDVRVGSGTGFLTLTFENSLVVRFKKLNASLEWSGIPTQQQQLFENQQEIHGLPARATFLVAGYVLNETGTRITRLVLTCRDGNALVWSHDLGSSLSGGAILPMPAPSAQPAPPTLRSKIRKKDSEEAN